MKIGGIERYGLAWSIESVGVPSQTLDLELVTPSGGCTRALLVMMLIVRAMLKRRRRDITQADRTVNEVAPIEEMLFYRESKRFELPWVNNDFKGYRSRWTEALKAPLHVHCGERPPV